MTAVLVRRSLPLSFVFSLLVAGSAVLGAAMGGMAYIQDDGTPVRPDTLQASGSDDSMVLLAASILFGGYPVLLGWLPAPLVILRRVAFVIVWLATLPFFYVECASYSGTVFVAHNWGVGAFLSFFFVSPAFLGARVLVQTIRRPTAESR